MQAGRQAGERVPRLVLRFAVFTALGLAFAAAAILLVVRHSDVVQAERHAIDRAGLLADAVLRHELAERDVARPVIGERRRELDRLFSDRALADGLLRATVYPALGAATYSTDHRLIGRRRHDVGRLREASAGEIVAGVESRPGAVPAKVLVTYVPFVVGGEQTRAVIALEQDYAPIAAAARQTFLPIAGVLEGVLLLLFVILAPMLARVSRRIRRHVHELDHFASHDDLTGLHNRLGFGRAVAAAMAAPPEAPVALLVVHLDGFREVNDALGESAGDELLVEASRRLTETARDQAVARLGGNEFGVLLNADTSAALELSERIRQALVRSYAVGEIHVAIDVSVGIAFAPAHGTDAQTVLRRAVVALRIARDRRSGVEVYDPSDDASDVSLLSLTAELREAIAAGQLVVHYQLQADLATGHPHGVEALVRWRHPQRGLIPPGAFIEAAERSGLITELGRHVLGVAARDWRRWCDLGYVLDLSVNLSAVDLLDLTLPDDVDAVLRRYGLPPERLVLEVTESSIMRDERRTENVLARLATLGVALAVDDFGTGYSSLAQLRRLPVREVKIDRSFVSGVPGDSAGASMVRWTVELAHSLGLRAVAEGVERREEWDYLRAVGCDRAQGYLLSKPLPADQLLERLAEGISLAA